MTAQIEELIDKVDTLELVRDQIAAILAVESAQQQDLAIQAGKDPQLWKLRVFLERANPWSDWQDAQDPQDPKQVDATPIINVAAQRATYDKSKSDPIQRQRTEAVFNIDCYGYGLSEGTTCGHEPGDLRAALEVQRAARLVRNILMSAQWAYLGMQGLVAGRWPDSLDFFQPAQSERPVQHVQGARIALTVGFNEFSPQVQGQPIELVSITVKRKETGEIYFGVDYGDET